MGLMYYLMGSSVWHVGEEIPCPRPEGWPGPWPSTVIVAACGAVSREYGMHLIPDSMGMADCKRCQRVLEK